MSSLGPLDNAGESSSSDEHDDTGVDGWEDVDSDQVAESFVCLFDTETFDSIIPMFEYCKAKYNFNIWQIQQQFDLDFLGLVKLVNYVRKSVKEGHPRPDLSSASAFDDELYLLPTMDSDAVLYNLEEILIASRPAAKTEIEELQEQMTALTARFDAYREDVKSYLGNNLEDVLKATHDATAPMTNGASERDDDYFHSYSFNAIHETMLKDRVRTDAYRDFIYDNKDLFKDKIVLDVGCGTGILSMFCANAGAKLVIAVDNSEIIETTKDIIRDNNLEHKIHLIKGKIEKVSLPVQKVDIIVSEWMGYCLLYESMLDSVIHARDNYLAPGGLMIPSHATLNVALLADSEVRDHQLEFWNEVYGFDMRPMKARAFAECHIKTVEDVEVGSDTAIFRTFDLRKVTVDDLSFEAAFTVQATQAANLLEGFVLWFDVYFNRNHDLNPTDLRPESAQQKHTTILSTSPSEPPTHWQQAVCFIKDSVALKSSTVTGSVRMSKSWKDVRALDVDMSWQLNNSAQQKQSWQLQ